MKKTLISKNNAGISKLLIIVVIAVVIIAAIGAVTYFFVKENTAEIGYSVNGIVVDDSDVFVYFNDEEIQKYEVEALHEFTLSGIYLYGISKNETRDITLFSKVVDKDGHIVQTLSETISVTGKGKYQIDLVFPSTTLNTQLTVDLTSDVIVTVSLLGGKSFGTYEVAAGSEEVFKGSIIVIPQDGVTNVLIKVAVDFSDGNIKYTEKNVNLVYYDTVEVALLVDSSTLTT